MPARIDPRQRRGHVVEAAFRLVVAEGIDGLSLRKVAAESGLNIGSVRHYFNGHEDLLAAAAEEAGDRMGRRLAHHPVDGLRGLTGAAALDALQALVEEVLPVDDERRDESIVVLELILAARTRPVFRPISERMAADLGRVVLDALTALGVRDPETGAAQITALIGGLTIDTVTPHGSLSVERLRATLRAQLRTLLNHHEET
ncbi:TetR/AcrR family transcriptional regulator [Marinactinospora rubrisoli]|uniref:TetR/AcrR family transcriptional regulator n=1 Tax=Marinactinospora rubrisoli TaxID=2715399 RepID=A0ABW2KIR1_9ACTN